jgi:RNA-binding protein YlmH
MAERASTSWGISYTHFLSPPVAADALAAVSQLPDLKAVAWGGYLQAERTRLAVGKEEVMLAAAEDPAALEEAVAALDVKGNFMFDPATHRDFLGAILGTGVVRDRVGVSAPQSMGRVRRPGAFVVAHLHSNTRVSFTLQP